MLKINTIIQLKQTIKYRKLQQYYTEQVNQVDSHTYDILSYDNFTTGLKTILI